MQEITTVQLIVFGFQLGTALLLGFGYVRIWTSRPFLRLKKIIDAQAKELEDRQKGLAYSAKRDQACIDIIHRLVRQLRDATGDDKGQFDLYAEIDEQMERRKKFEETGRAPRWMLKMEDEHEKSSKL